jgi:hypothetical protein
MSEKGRKEMRTSMKKLIFTGLVAVVMLAGAATPAMARHLVIRHSDGTVTEYHTVDNSPWHYQGYLGPGHRSPSSDSGSSEEDSTSIDSTNYLCYLSADPC